MNAPLHALLSFMSGLRVLPLIGVWSIPFYQYIRQGDIFLGTVIRCYNILSGRAGGLRLQVMIKLLDVARKVAIASFFASASTGAVGISFVEQ